MFNDAPIYVVPYLFSYQHILLLLISVAYIICLCLILRKRTYKTQRIVFITIMSICCVIFFCRMFFGFEHARIWNEGSKTTLLPLELCNLNIIITLIGVIINKKFLNNYLYFVSVLGAIVSLTIFPQVHMNLNLFTEYMFFDYYIIHTNLVAVPIAMIACKWFKPEFKYTYISLLMLFVIYTALFGITTFLRQFEPFENANYMYIYDPGTLPILSQLYSLIPIPYVYVLPLIILIYQLFVLMWLPFGLHTRYNKKIQFKNLN